MSVKNNKISFREDVFSKVVTYITVAVLLGAMLVEAFVIYMERNEKDELAARMDLAQESISNLTELNLQLSEEKQALQEFKDNWGDLVILADNELCQQLREELSGREELIPEAAIEASILAEEADMLTEESLLENQADELTIKADFVFPDSGEKDWLIPLNLGNEPNAEYLFYVRAVDEKRERYIDLLYEVPVDRESGEIEKDEDGRVIWSCMAYDAGLGWQLYMEEEEMEE